MDLILAVKKEYFDQIKSGEKKVEYRIYKDFWRKRLEGKKFQQVIITLGYPKKGDFDKIIIFPWNGYYTEEIIHPHFGSESVKVFAINLEKVKL